MSVEEFKIKIIRLTAEIQARAREKEIQAVAVFNRDRVLTMHKAGKGR